MSQCGLFFSLFTSSREREKEKEQLYCCTKGTLCDCQKPKKYEFCIMFTITIIIIYILKSLGFFFQSLANTLTISKKKVQENNLNNKIKLKGYKKCNRQDNKIVRNMEL